MRHWDLPYHGQVDQVKGHSNSVFLGLPNSKTKNIIPHNLDLPAPGRKCWFFFTKERLLLKEDNKR